MNIKLIKNLLALILLFASSVQAHQLSTSYLTLNEDLSSQPVYNGYWQVDVDDISQQIGFDINNDGAITWQEISFKQAAISEFVKSVITFKQSGRNCVITSQGQLSLANHFNKPFLHIPMSVSCYGDDLLGNNLEVSYAAFFELDDNHKSIMHINNISRVYTSNDSGDFFTFKQDSLLTTALEYTYQGILHIWIGIDHILFLIALLLTCVLVRKDKNWQANPSKMKILKQTAWMITAFTLAHSITLTATALDLLTPSSRWVEFGIAISVLFAALNNIWPWIVKLGWVTFAFGLLHGMGFASVLGELGLSSEYQLMSILTFNLGVELGQLAILAASLPLLILIRNHDWYKRWLMPTGSIAIALVAFQWSMQRF